MAIKFVDVEPDGEGAKPKKARQTDVPTLEREPDAEARRGSLKSEVNRPEPRPRGRKKPLK